MADEPTSKGLGASVCQQINRPMSQKIDEDGPIGVTTPKREIIDANDSGYLLWLASLHRGQA